MTSAYVLDRAEFRKDEDLLVGVYTGRFGRNLNWSQVLCAQCIQRSGARDIWGDAYHALYRYESGELVIDDGQTEQPAQRETSKQRRVSHLTCFIERNRARVQDASARFTVSISSAGRVRGEAVATGQQTVEIARMRVNPLQLPIDIVLEVLLHLATIEHPEVRELMQRIRRADRQ